MVLAVTALTSGEDTDGGTSATSASITPTGNALVICDVMNIDADFSAPATVTVAGNGITWTSVATLTHFNIGANDLIRITRFRGMVASPSSGTVVITAAVAQLSIAYSIYEITGVDTSGTHGSGAVVQTVTNDSADVGVSSLTITLAAFGSANNMAIGAFCYGGEGTSDFSVGTGFTQIHETATALLFTEYKLNDTTVDASNSTTQPLAGIASEIKEAAGGGTTVTPGVLNLTLSSFAPKANMRINGASPSALVLSSFAPQANMKINAAAPSALVTSAFAPVLRLAINGASPTALVTNSFAPVIGMQVNGASPTALLLSAFAPTVTASGNQTVTPTTLALLLASFAPQLKETLTAQLLALTLATFAPQANMKINAASPLALALSAFAPKLLEQLTPGPAALVITGFAPRLAEVVTPGAAALVTAKFAPSLQEVVAPGALALVTQGFAPALGNSVLVTPGVLALTLALFAPTISGADVAQVIGLMSLFDEATARAILNDSRVSTATLRDELTAHAQVRD